MPPKCVVNARNSSLMLDDGVKRGGWKTTGGLFGGGEFQELIIRPITLSLQLELNWAVTIIKCEL